MGTSITLPGGKDFDGTDYTYVYADKSPIKNGKDLSKAVKDANERFQTTNIPQTVLLGPGNYNLNFNQLSIEGSVNITGLTDNRKEVKIYPGSLNFDKFNNPQSNIYSLADGFASSLQNLMEELVFNGYIYNSSYVDNNGDTIFLLRRQFDSPMLLRLNTRTNEYKEFNPGDFGTIYADPDTQAIYYIIGGSPTTLKKINSTFDGFDTTFANPVFNNWIRKIVVDKNTGSIFVAGFFTSVNGVSKGRIVKLNSNGTIDNSFNIGSGFNYLVEDITINYATNQIAAVGPFVNYAGITCQNFILIDINTGTGSLPSGQSVPFNASPQRIFWSSSDNIYLIGGNFSMYNGNSYPYGSIITNQNGGSDYSFLDGYTQGLSPNYFNFKNVEANPSEIYVYLSNENSLLGVSINPGNAVYKINVTPTGASIAQTYSVSYGAPTTPIGALLYFKNSDNQEYIFYPKYMIYSDFAVFSDSNYLYGSPPNVHSNFTTPGAIRAIGNLNIIPTLKNVHVGLLTTDEDINNPGFVYNNYLYKVENSYIQNLTFSQGELIIKNSEIERYTVNNKFHLNGIRCSLALTLEGVTCYGLYTEQEGMNLVLTIKDSNIQNSFGNLTTGVLDKYINLNRPSVIVNLDINDSKIYDSFNQSYIASNRCINNELVGYCFNYTNNGSDYLTDFFSGYNLTLFNCTARDGDMFRVVYANYSSWPSYAPIETSNNITVSGFKGSNLQSCFIFDFSVSYKSLVAFNDVNVDSCVSAMIYTSTLLDASVFSVFDSTIDLQIINCSINGYLNQPVTDCMSYFISGFFTNNNYNNSEHLTNFIFRDCTVNSKSEVTGNIFNIYTTGYSNDLVLNNFTFNNCNITGNNLGSTFLSKFTIDGTKQLSIIDLKFTDCSVLSGSAFLNEINSSLITLNGVQFINCECSFGFITNPGISTIDIAAELLFSNCTAYQGGFLVDSVGVEYTGVGPITFKNCKNLSRQAAFVFSQSETSFFSSAFKINFINCLSEGKSFYVGFVGIGNVTIFAEFCQADENSFGGFYGPTNSLNFTGNISHCVVGEGSFGTYLNQTIDCTGLEMNLSNTSGSIGYMQNYSGTYNV